MRLPYFSRELKAGEVRRNSASYKTCIRQQSGQCPAKNQELGQREENVG